ncbi:MAG: DUF4388 domain-containing protein [Deltaproteobacteria bacterium]|nr:DUF4388 domain-containing protein [Deltaproteobacteria bacterium]MBW2399827.1 DUF4388 domain-containing protein [Deltaproteobacteria bacterium]
MSLVGSLEDLSLGDILQIISLSRKSGLLQLRSEEGEGRIVFCEGLVRAGFVKGEVEDLKGLLVVGGFIAEAAYDKAAVIAAAHGDALDEVLATMSAISKERIDSLRREQVERSVFRMFSWTTGEFSFEVSDSIDDRDRDLLVSTGINAQYLTMEATRIGDEFENGDDDDIEFGTVDGESGADIVEAEVAAESEVENCEIADALAMAAVERAEADGANDGDDAGDGADETAASELQLDAEPDEPTPDSLPVAEIAEPVASVVEAEPVSEPDAGPSAPESSGLAALILIDHDLAALEWQKSVLGPICRRIHVFQRAEGGISRLRQYLIRGEEPMVLVSDDLPPDPRAGIEGSPDLIRRMRAQAPRMQIYLVSAGTDATSVSLGDANGSLQRPANHQLSNRRTWSKLEGDGESLRNALLNRSEPDPPVRECASVAEAESVARAAVGPNDAHSDLQRLKRTSERLRDPSVRGEVLSLILEYAAGLFSRVAIFMIRDDEAIGMAQSGLASAGGPDDSEFRQVSIPANEPSWFRKVLQSGEATQAPPQDDGDRQLAALLGSSIPKKAYVAPIESGRNVVALVYADNLPGDDPIGDTTSLEIALHEAGLALERALLERALADSGAHRSA